MTPSLPHSALIATLDRRLVVSCQALPGSAMDRSDIIVAMAQAAVDGGAAALRIEGVAQVRAVCAAISVPVIGIVKRDLADTPVRITPFAQDVRDLAEAGAAIIAFDATARERPESVAALLAATRQAGCLAMADCATEADGLAAWQLGCEFIGTTMSGYTAETADRAGTEPDLDLVERLARAGCRVIAEGRMRTPEQAAAAMRCGAYSVTVGSAITRIEHITEWFVDAMSGVSR